MEKIKVKVEDIKREGLNVGIVISYVDPLFGDVINATRRIQLGLWDAESKSLLPDEQTEIQAEKQCVYQYGVPISELETIIGSELDLFLAEDGTLYFKEPLNPIPAELIDMELEGEIVEVAVSPSQIVFGVSNEDYSRLKIRVGFMKDGNIDGKKRTRQIQKLLKATPKDITSPNQFEDLIGGQIRCDVKKFVSEDGVEHPWAEVKKITK